MEKNNQQTVFTPQVTDFRLFEDKGRLTTKDEALEYMRMNGRKFTGKYEELPDPSQRKTLIYLCKHDGGTEVFFYET